MLTAYTRSFLREHLLDRDAHHPFPPAADRDGWRFHDPLQESRRAWVIEQAEATRHTPWPLLPATLYMEFGRNGNRTHYQAPYFERRKRLGTLVLAECLEHQGRWLDEVVNGLWALLGEPTWCLPAHAGGTPEDPLPQFQTHLVDLFNCETGFVLAETLYLLRAELTAISPAFVQHLEAEIDARLFQPVERLGDAIGWFNGSNNWTPWCASNILGAACYLLTDRDRLAGLAAMLNVAVERFIDNYGDDGGCDEGPMYWNRAAGSMFDYLTRLEQRLDVQLDTFQHPKIKAMAEFFVTAHLHEEWLLNFADASARGRGNPARLYTFGQRVGSQAMQDLAICSAAGFGDELDPRLQVGTGDFLHAGLCTIFRLPADATPTPPRKPLTTWLNDIQVAVVREYPETGRGLILGAKGGHNRESHNHNDVGQFIVMLDGQPCIVDVGTQEYNRQTFSPQRYEIWNIRGSGHNPPVIGGVEQQAGRDYCAHEVTLREDDGSVTLEMEISSAYPAEASVASLHRSLCLDRHQQQLAVRDRITFRDQPAEVQLTFYSPQQVKASGGEVMIGPLAMYLDAPWRIEVTTIKLDDHKLISSWGEKLQRIRLLATPTESTWSYKLRMCKRPEQS